MNKLIDKLPGLDLHCREVITDALQMRDVGGAIIYAQRGMAQRFAEMIVKERKFFEAKEQPGGQLIDIRADCVVLTSDELRDALSDMFRQGIEYGRMT